MPYNVLNPDNATVIAPPSPDPSIPKAGVGITLEEAVEELRSMLKGRIDIEPDRLIFWLNRAYTDLATSLQKQDELRSSLSFSTEAGQAQYLLPSLVTTTLSLARLDTDNAFGGIPLEKKDLVWYRRQKDWADGWDRAPTAFFRLDRLLVLWPTPDDAYEMVLDFRYEPRPLDADEDSPIMRTEWHEAWLTLARKKILSAVSEFEASIAVGNEFVGHMRVRQDREAGEDENKIVSSSVPRDPRTMRRRSRSGPPFLGQG